MVSPLVITSDPIPTTTATSSDLIASHVDSKEFHSVTAHNPWNEEARILASSPNLLLATISFPKLTPSPTTCVIHSNVHFHADLPASGKVVTPDQVKVVTDPRPTQVLFYQIHQHSNHHALSSPTSSEDILHILQTAFLISHYIKNNHNSKRLHIDEGG